RQAYADGLHTLECLSTMGDAHLGRLRRRLAHLFMTLLPGTPFRLARPMKTDPLFHLHQRSHHIPMQHGGPEEVDFFSCDYVPDDLPTADDRRGADVAVHDGMLSQNDRPV